MPGRAPKHRPYKADAVAHVPAEAVRLTTAQRGYGGRWQKARETFLKRAPLCAECQRHGRVTLARIVDHVIPHRGDQDHAVDLVEPGVDEYLENGFFGTVG